MPLVPSTPRQPREPRPQSPQLTLRVATLGGIAVVLFAVLFFRLWVLQVLSAEHYSTEGFRNGSRTVRVPAQRGRILDDHGLVIVQDRASNAIALDAAQTQGLARRCLGTRPAGVDVAGERHLTALELRRRLHGLTGRARRRRRAVLRKEIVVVRYWAGCSAGLDGLVVRRIAALTKTPVPRLENAIHRAMYLAPFEPVTLLTDVPRALVFYLKEHGADFRGISVTKRSLRDYPRGTFAAHVLGQLSQITRQQLDAKDPHYVGAQEGDVVGQTGVERAYDRWLRGRDGTLQLVVDAAGNPVGPVAVRPAPQPGLDLRLTIDARIQRAAEHAIGTGIAVAHANGNTAAARGAILAMDVRTGAIRALASFPTFLPARLIGSGADDYFAQLNAPTPPTLQGPEAPLLNRAIAGLYPPGSTFKPATAIAALQSGLMSVDTPIDCTGSYKVDGHVYKNYEGDTNSAITLAQAITQSCNTYFYRVGKILYDRTGLGREPQPYWARRLGFGARTGIDLLGERPGLVPDIAYKKRRYRNDLINNAWTSGDAVLTSIGQGDVQVTPLQLASMYALIANGGTLVTPHVAADVQGPDGSIRFQVAPPPRRKLPIDAYVLSTIQAGLRGVTHDQNGTAAHAFAGFPVPVAGKTGTAQKPPLANYSLFAGYAPLDHPQLVVVAVIEQGGLGGEAAAAAVREVMSAAFDVKRSVNGEASQPVDLDGRPIDPDLQQIQNATTWNDPTVDANGSTITDSSGRSGTAYFGVVPPARRPPTTTAPASPAAPPTTTRSGP